MRKRPLGERRIFFPWEGRGGLRRYFALGRLRPFVLFGLVLVFVGWVGMRERRATGIRQTRATLLDLRRAVDAYLSEHDGGCPETLEQVLAYTQRQELPRDAWGQDFRFVCPTDAPGLTYELMSDGPDRKPGGLDRIQ